MVLRAAPWPVHLWPSKCDFMPEHQTRSGGASISGAEQIIASPATRLRARMTLPAMNERTILSWRALVAGMSGRAGTVLVPTWNVFAARDANGRRFNTHDAVRWGGDIGQEGVSFDLSGWGQDDTPVYATLADDVAINATEITVNYAEGIDGLRPGQYFGIGQRLYIVTQTWQENEGDPVHIRFTPWLRAAASGGDTVIIDRPVCLMRFAQDQTGDLDLDLGRWGSGGLEFIEVY